MRMPSTQPRLRPSKAPQEINKIGCRLFRAVRQAAPTGASAGARRKVLPSPYSNLLGAAPLRYHCRSDASQVASEMLDGSRVRAFACWCYPPPRAQTPLRHPFLLTSISSVEPVPRSPSMGLVRCHQTLRAGKPGECLTVCRGPLQSDCGRRPRKRFSYWQWASRSSTICTRVLNLTYSSGHSELMQARGCG